MIYSPHKIQALKQTFSIGLRRSALILSELLHPQPHILVNDCLLCVGDNLIFLFWILDYLMHLVTDSGGFPIHRAARVLPVFQNTLYCAFTPAINICRNRITRLSSY